MHSSFRSAEYPVAQNGSQWKQEDRTDKEAPAEVDYEDGDLGNNQNF